MKLSSFATFRGRILCDEQLVGAHVDAAQRRHSLFEIVAAIIGLGEHDLGVAVAGGERDRPFQPSLGVVEGLERSAIRPNWRIAE
jgi:hypothetical protein